MSRRISTRYSRAGRILPGAALLVALGARAHAQPSRSSLLSSRVSASNDAFNFWLAPWYRPDEEYTNGVMASLVYSGPAWWHRAMSRDVELCRDSRSRCATHDWAFGQQIFTGERHIGDTSPADGSRPNAGWLYVEEMERTASVTRLDEWSVTVGVTGPPALAQFVQRVAHGYAAAYNRPVDWTAQLPFEPGFILRYEQSRRLGTSRGASAWNVGVEPHLGGALGTVRTEVSGGMRVRVTRGARHPWLPPEESSRLQLTWFADASARGVAHNLFLDGSLFQSSTHVQSRAFVNEFEAGFSAQWHRLGAGYRVHWTGPEYTTRTTSHTWASLDASWRIAPW